MQFLDLETPMELPAATIYDEHQRRYVRRAERVACAAYKTAMHLSAGIEGVRTHASVSLLRTSAGRSGLSREQWRLALADLEKLLRLHS